MATDRTWWNIKACPAHAGPCTGLWFIVALKAWPPGASVPLIGALWGVVMAGAARRRIAALVAGDSRSFGRYLATLSCLPLTLLLGVPAALVQLNGSSDSAPPVAARGLVEALGRRLDRGSQAWATGAGGRGRRASAPRRRARV